MKLLKFHLLFQIFKIIVIKLQYLFFDNYSILYNNFNSSMRILNMKVVALQEQGTSVLITLMNASYESL